MCDSFQEEIVRYLQVIDDFDRRGVYSDDFGADFDPSARRVIIACRIIEANLATFASIWEAVEMPKEDLIVYFEANFAEYIAGCLLVVAKLTDNKSQTVKKIMRCQEKINKQLRTCSEDALGTIVALALVRSMLLVQILLNGESSEFQNQSMNVDSLFLAESLEKAGLTLTNSTELRPSCRAVAEHVETLL